jgi:hypothetical protein
MDQDPESFEIVNPVGQPKVQRPVVQTPLAHQAYVLPQQEYNGNPWGLPAKASPWTYQNWGNPYEQQYEQVHVPTHVHAVYPHAHPAFFSSHYPFAREVGW